MLDVTIAADARERARQTTQRFTSRSEMLAPVPA